MEGRRESLPVSHKSATRAVYSKKGNLASTRIPFKYSNGAEGGTRTPTGLPTTPSSPGHAMKFPNPFTYRIVTAMPKSHIP